MVSVIWGSPLDLIYKWRERYRVDETTDELKPSAEREADAEISRLKRELAIVIEERDILKKSHSSVQQGSPTMIFAFIERHQNEFCVRRMCQLLKVSSSGFMRGLSVNPVCERKKMQAWLWIFERCMNRAVRLTAVRGFRLSCRRWAGQDNQLQTCRSLDTY